MPSPSQPGPPNRPSSPPSSSSRRLRSPSERFGPAPEPLVESGEEIAAAPTSEPRSASASARSQKHRHERHRFERRPLDAKRRTARTASRNQHASSAPTLSVEPSPTLLRIQATRRRFWRRFTIAFCTLSLAGAAAAALFAPAFNINSVTITGLHATSPDLVRPIAAKLLGHNVFRASKSLVVQGVERVPTIAKARIVLRAGLPPRVVLQVRERQPILRVGSGTNWWVADEQGVFYRTASARDANLPMLHWNGPIGTMKRFDPALWSDAARLATAINSKTPSASGATGEFPRVREMSLDTAGDATLVLQKSPGAPELLVRLGNDNWDEKIARAREALVYFDKTRRDAGELNMVALDAGHPWARWTPRTFSAPSDAGSAPNPTG